MNGLLTISAIMKTQKPKIARKPSIMYFPRHQSVPVQLYRRRVLEEQLSYNIDRAETFDHPVGDATPYIEKVDGQFHYVISERGQEYKRVASADPYEILRLLFDDVTFTMASQFEVNNRAAYQDCRRILFAKQVELLGTLDPAWAQSQQKEQQRILKENPFDDRSMLRGSFGEWLLRLGRRLTRR